MLQDNQIPPLKKQIIEDVSDEYGIYLLSDSVEIKTKKELILFYVNDYLISETEYEPEVSIEDFSWDLIDQEEVKDNLSTAKAISLKKEMSEIIQRVVKYVTSGNMGSNREDIIVDIEPAENNKEEWMTDEEAELGYPDFALSLRDFDKFNFFYKIDPDRPAENFDMIDFQKRVKNYINNYSH